MAIGIISTPREIPHDLQNTSNLMKLSANYPTIIGESNEYLSDYFGADKIDRLPCGGSILICAPVGSGKTSACINAVINLLNSPPVYILTNRKSSAIQIKRDVLEAQGESVRDWNPRAILRASTGNIHVKTYQELAQSDTVYLFKTGTILVFDECHALLNDSTFSDYPIRIEEIISANLARTKRIYISATLEETAAEIHRLERFDKGNLETLSFPYYVNSHISELYYMKSSYSHLNFRFYNYSDKEGLAEELKKKTDVGEKSVIFVRSKTRGNELRELLGDSLFVHSSEEEQETLTAISLNESFETDSLISTKVLENGTSITDPDIGTIVCEEIDPVSLVQFIGRVRVKRKKPRQLTIMIPDYTVKDLRQAENQCVRQIRTIEQVMDNPGSCMRSYTKFYPFVYYSEQNGPTANYLAYKKLNMLRSHIQKLIDEGTHSHIRHVLSLFNHNIEIDDRQFLDYDDIRTFKDGVNGAYNIFCNSSMLKQQRDELAKELIQIVEKTNYYDKKITGKQINIDTINSILNKAGIESSIHTLGEAFSISTS